MNQVRLSTARSLLVIACVAASAASGCRHDRSTANGSTGAGTASVALAGGAAARSDDAVKVQPARPDPCSFVPIGDAKRLLGPLSGQPWRAVSADDTTSASDGLACIYPLVARENVAEHSVIALELKPEGALGFENGVAMAAGAGNGFDSGAGNCLRERSRQVRRRDAVRFPDDDERRDADRRGAVALIGQPHGFGANPVGRGIDSRHRFDDFGSDIVERAGRD